MFLLFDTETDGLPKDKTGQASMFVLENWPRVIQLAWALCDVEGNVVHSGEKLIRPDGWKVPEEKFWIENGFSQAKSMKEGVLIRAALAEFIADLAQAEIIVAHNMAFDYNIIGAEMLRLGLKGKKTQKICTMEAATNFCCIPFDGQRAYMSKVSGRFKFPKLSELYRILFQKEFEGAHRADADVEALRQCFFELLKRKIIELPEIKANETS